MRRHSGPAVLAVLAIPLASLASLVCLPTSLQAAEISGKFDFEGRLFPQEGLNESRQRGNFSLSFEPELYYEWQQGRQSLTVAPFLRWDQNDSERTHADVRELTWQFNADRWELRAGVRKVFWGVTESQHLVDVINQTDLVENLDGEDKLGQPMLNLALIRAFGTIDLFLLTGFRERTFPGIEGRPGFPIPVNSSDAEFESSQGRGHVDWALRWAHTLRSWDVGVSHFSGTSREPRYLPRPSTSGQLQLIPLYDLINQTGLDLQLTTGSWLWKLEAITRTGQGDDRLNAFTGGYEYSFFNIRSSGIDVGLLTEYSFDDRGDEALTPFQDDIFAGVRLAFNDVQSTEILAGAAVDRKSGASFINLEASRRFGASWTLDVQLRAFAYVPEEDRFLFGLRNDDYFQVACSWHF